MDGTNPAAWRNAMNDQKGVKLVVPAHTIEAALPTQPTDRLEMRHLLAFDAILRLSDYDIKRGVALLLERNAGLESLWTTVEGDNMPVGVLEATGLLGGYCEPGETKESLLSVVDDEDDDDEEDEEDEEDDEEEEEEEEEDEEEDEDEDEEEETEDYLSVPLNSYERLQNPIIQEGGILLSDGVVGLRIADICDAVRDAADAYLRDDDYYVGSDDEDDAMSESE